MKRLSAYLIFAFCLGAAITQAQSLSFNQVLLVSAADTVPAGKVWKVTSVLGTDNMFISTGTSSGQSNLITITVNGTSVYTKASWGASGGTSAIEVSAVPMWFPPGTILAPSTGAYGMTVIEFDVVP